MAVALSKARHSEISHFYFDYLREAVDTLERALVRLKDCDSSRCEPADAIDISHRIKGNAAMYGYPELGLIAGTAETRLRNLTQGADPANALLSLIDLIDKIHDICQSQGRSEPLALQNTSAVPAIDTVSASQSAAVCLDRRRVLIAYEDIWVSELMASLFGSEFSTMICQTGDAVQSEIRRQKPDLIILDSGFGALDDLNFLRALKDNKYAQNVSIFMTFDPAAHQLMAEALSLGVEGFAEDKHEVLDIVISAKSILQKQVPKVLVVDDDPVVRDLLSHVLSAAGMEVDTLNDGLEALKYLSQTTPDIVLLDRFMPRLEGGTVLYEIQNKINLKSIPVLILTAMVNHGEAASWFERGAADFIPKPFDPEEVLMRVKQHLKHEQKIGSKPCQ